MQNSKAHQKIHKHDDAERNPHPHHQWEQLKCNIPGLETRNSEENDVCIAFMHLKTWKIFAQVI
jgi:hypothetical protein